MRALAVLLLVLCAACGREDARADVLVIVADSLAASHVSSHVSGGVSGHGPARPTTPAFDAFAAECVRFEQAGAPAAWTLPSVASLFTSKPQEVHGARDDELALRSDLPTLAERFADAGWSTRAIVQTPVLSSRTGVGRGFQRYEVLDFSLASFERSLALARGALDEAQAPHFVYLHVAPPHMPYQPPPPFRGRFSAESEALAHVDGSIASARAVHRARLAPEHPDVVRLAALYDEHVAFVDARLGELVHALRARATRRPLLIVWTSDHGEAFMEHGEQGHNSNVYEELLHVPLALAAPGLSSRVESTPVSLLDLAPTLLELCDLPALPHSAGRSLMPLVRDEPFDSERALLASSRHYENHPERWQVAVRSGRFKLHVWPALGRAELRDLELDPLERNDCGAAHPHVRERLLREFERLQREFVEAPDRGELSASEQRALRELGYFDDAGQSPEGTRR